MDKEDNILISNAGLRYYDRNTDKEFVILEGTILDIEIYQSSELKYTKTITGRLDNYFAGVITIDSSEKYKSKLVKISLEQIRRITPNSLNGIDLLEIK